MSLLFSVIQLFGLLGITSIWLCFRKQYFPVLVTNKLLLGVFASSLDVFERIYAPLSHAGRVHLFSLPVFRLPAWSGSWCKGIELLCCLGSAARQRGQCAACRSCPSERTSQPGPATREPATALLVILTHPSLAGLFRCLILCPFLVCMCYS